jgi:hypothetical protein
MVATNGASTRTARAKALTAAAMPIGRKGLSATLLQRTMSTSGTWQTGAWGYFDEVPEIHMVHEFLGNAVGRMRLFPQFQANPTDPPIPLDPEDTALQSDVRKAAAVAAATLDRLDSSMGGIQGLQASLGLNAALVGEVFLWGHLDREAATGESFEAISTREVTVQGEEITVTTDGSTAGTRVDQGSETFIRIWRRHPAYRLRADSAMRSLATTCDELLLLTRSIRAVATSRLAGAGFLKVPDELSFVSPSIDGGEAPEDGADDPLLETLLINMTTPIADPDSAAAVVPMMVKGPAEALKEFMHQLIERPFDQLAIQLREEAVQRLARGLDIPPEVLTGLSDSNHWSAWQIEEQTFKSHIEPLVQMVIDGITTGFLQPVLQAANIPQWNRVTVGYDPSDLVGHPNDFPNATVMHEAFAVSDAFLRSKGGAGDEDAPDEDEIARRIAQRGAIPPEVETVLLRLSDILPKLEEIIPAPGGEGAPQGGGGAPSELPAGPENVTRGPPPNPEEPQPEDRAGRPGREGVAAAGGRRSDLGERLAALDRALLARVLALAEQTVQRAVEMIGARIIRSLSNAPVHAEARAQVRDVPLDRVAWVLGADKVRQLGVVEDEILAKHLSSMESQFLRSVARTRAEAVRLTRGTLGEAPRGFDEEHWEDAMEENADLAWRLLLHGLTAAAAQALYEAEPESTSERIERLGNLISSAEAEALPEVAAVAGVEEALHHVHEVHAAGEVPVESLVPAGTVRDALAVAGGAKQGTPDVRPTEAPEGMVAVGDGMLGLLHDAYRQVVSGWTWVYGDPSARSTPFEPHEALDGVEFERWDDEVLANTEAWPDAEFYAPGDHYGCLCDFEVRFAEAPDDTTAEEAQ